MKDSTLRPALTYYLGEQSNGAAKLRDAYWRGIGRCFVHRPINPLPGEQWFLDNGVFPVWNQHARVAGLDYSKVYAHFESRFARVAELVADGRGPDFMVIPDRPGEASSLNVSRLWLERYVTDIKPDFDPDGVVPLYLVVQDGFAAADVEALIQSDVGHVIGGIFLGGNDPFKFQTIDTWRAVADRYGLRLHYGRCTQSKLAHAIEAGCDSGDSSHPLRLTGTRWERFLEVYDRTVGSIFAGRFDREAA